MRHIKKWNTNLEYNIAKNNLILPNVSYIVEDHSVYYKKDEETSSFNGFCKIITNNEAIEIEGSGELNYQIISNYLNDYKSSMIGLEIGPLCTSIDESTFESCYNLESVIMHEGITSIDNSAFYDCSSLTNINIPNSVTHIGNSAFSETPWWETYSEDENNQYGNIIYINDIAYIATSKYIDSCEFKPTTTHINDMAFNGCTSLTNIVIPNSVISIGSSAFFMCGSLSSITIGSSVTNIGNAAFSVCRQLNTIISLATTAPTVYGSFYDIKNGGTLYVPQGSTGYDAWMSSNDFYLGKYNWTKVEQ